MGTRLKRRFNSLHFIGLSAALITLGALSAAEDNCLTYPDRSSGVCIAIKQCPFHIDQLLKVPTAENSEELRTILRRNQCGLHEKQVLVCCPKHAANNSSEGKLAVAAESAAQTCGTRRLPSFANGNTQTYLGEYPWLALIEYTSAKHEKSHFCSGALISDHYVLTAAHCAMSLALRDNWQLTAVRLGEWNTTSDPDCEIRDKESLCAPGYQDINVTQVIIHPRYTPSHAAQPYDIALLRLQRAAVLSDFVRPICLPDSTLSTQTDQYANNTIYRMEVGGWRNTNATQQKSAVHIWTLKKCKERYGTHKILIQGEQICGEPIGSEYEKCQGNSGGPLMYNDHGVYTLLGVLSFGPRQCGAEGWPDIYTNVLAYRDWINSHIKAI